MSVRPATQARVGPYRSVRVPLAFVATIPPRLAPPSVGSTGNM
jgi:hypothetical protein